MDISARCRTCTLKLSALTDGAQQEGTRCRRGKTDHRIRAVGGRMLSKLAGEEDHIGRRPGRSASILADQGEVISERRLRAFPANPVGNAANSALGVCIQGQGPYERCSSGPITPDG